MPEPSKTPNRRIYDATAHNLQGMHLKAVNDFDLDRIIDRAKHRSAPVKADLVEEAPFTREIILRLIALLKEL